MSLIVSALILWALFKGIRSLRIHIEKLCGGATAKTLLICMGILVALVVAGGSGICADWFLMIPATMLAIACMLVIWKYVLNTLIR